MRCLHRSLSMRFGRSRSVPPLAAQRPCSEKKRQGTLNTDLILLFFRPAEHLRTSYVKSMETNRLVHLCAWTIHVFSSVTIRKKKWMKEENMMKEDETRLQWCTVTLDTKFPCRRTTGKFCHEVERTGPEEWKLGKQSPTINQQSQ